MPLRRRKRHLRATAFTRRPLCEIVFEFAEKL
jgi:hypothetical protein